MTGHNRYLKITVIIVLIVLIFILHYSTINKDIIKHAVYRMLFYLPLILGSFWFGIKGAIGVSATVVILYTPYAYFQWGKYSHDFHIVLEGVLYVCLSLILGYLSEREKREQAARLEAERLASIGRAVSEIAHDMKSPLMAIGGFVSQVSQKLDPEKKERKKLEIVIKETSRLETMVKEMLDFGHPMELQKSMVNINNLAGECVEAVLPIAESYNVDIFTEFDTDLPLVSMDGNRIKEVIVNLVTNALEVSPPGEKVLVKTLPAQNDILLEISDHGKGVKKEDMDKIFDPFYSTKKSGTGLGLAIVKKILAAHKGNVSVRQNPDKGVTFSLRIPHDINEK